MPVFRRTLAGQLLVCRAAGAEYGDPYDVLLNYTMRGTVATFQGLRNDDLTALRSPIIRAEVRAALRADGAHVVDWDRCHDGLWATRRVLT